MALRTEDGRANVRDVDAVVVVVVLTGHPRLPAAKRFSSSALFGDHHALATLATLAFVDATAAAWTDGAGELLWQIVDRKRVGHALGVAVAADGVGWGERAKGALW